LKLKRNSFETV